jgi:hypothetical protein
MLMRFSRCLPLLIGGFLLSLPVAAQSRIRNGLFFGGVGAQIDGDGMGGYHKGGITGGLSSTIHATDRWNVRLEVSYIQKGARSPSQDSTTYRYQPPDPTQIPTQQQPNYAQQQAGQFLRFRLNYVQIPILVEYRATPKVTLYGGASADYLLRGTVDYGFGYGAPLGVQFRQTDLMGHAGADLALGDRWAVTMRLMYSLRDISTERIGTDRYLLFAGRVGGYRNNILSTTLRFYLGDAPKFKGTPLFRKRDSTAPPTSADDGEPTTP